jgi:hypothetical protein
MEETNQLTLQITCKGYTTVELDELHELQDPEEPLKDLYEKDYVRLRNSLTKFGFTFPVFYWQDPEGTKWIVDAHQRKKTLKKMRDEHWIIPPLPADEIMATDKIEAKQKLLLQESTFGRMTQEGYDHFVEDVPMDDISDMLSLPVMTSMPDENREGVGGEPTHHHDLQEVVCPNCQHRFTPEVV